MEMCRSDSEKTVRLLESAAAIIERRCTKPCELDKARLCRNMARKISRKLEKRKEKE